MENDLKTINISEEEKNLMISRLVDELPVLRTKMGVSQDELANMIGISRQTYSSLETRKRKMTWSIFLSLLLVFDYNEQTHNVIHKEGLFPKAYKEIKMLVPRISLWHPLCQLKMMILRIIWMNKLFMQLKPLLWLNTQDVIIFQARQ